jgi:hypothetical protein
MRAVALGGLTVEVFLWTLAAIMFLSGFVGSLLVYKAYGWDYFRNGVVLLSALVLGIPSSGACYVASLASPPGSVLRSTFVFMTIIAAPFMVGSMLIGRFIGRRAAWWGIQSRGNYGNLPNRESIDAWARKTGRLSDAPINPSDDTGTDGASGAHRTSAST